MKIKQDHSECPYQVQRPTQLLDGLQGRLWFTVGANTLIAEAPGKILIAIIHYCLFNSCFYYLF